MNHDHFLKFSQSVDDWFFYLTSLLSKS